MYAMCLCGGARRFLLFHPDSLRRDFHLIVRAPIQEVRLHSLQWRRQLGGWPHGHLPTLVVGQHRASVFVSSFAAVAWLAWCTPFERLDTSSVHASEALKLCGTAVAEDWPEWCSDKGPIITVTWFIDAVAASLIWPEACLVAALVSILIGFVTAVDTKRAKPTARLHVERLVVSSRAALTRFVAYTPTTATSTVAAVLVEPSGAPSACLSFRLVLVVASTTSAAR